METEAVETELRSRVRALLHANGVTGYSSFLGAHYNYIAPSKERYQFQWFWDTCFHVFIQCALGEIDSAKENLRSLFRMQDDDGFVGHMIFWNQTLPHSLADIVHAKLNMQTIRPHMSALIQPPLVAQALKRIYAKTGDKLFLLEMLPKIIAYHEWLARNRDFDGDGLISIISPSESGVDWKPSFDEAVGSNVRTKAKYLLASKLFWRVASREISNFLNGYSLLPHQRRFAVKEVTVNTAYACDLRMLSQLCLTAGLRDDAIRYIRRAEQVGRSMQEFLYDHESSAFYDALSGSNKKLKVLTAMSFLPIVLPETPQEVCKRMVQKHLNNPEEFLSTYPVPSVAMNDPAYYPKESSALWRGPTWPVMNWFLFNALRVRGFTEESHRLRESLSQLIAKSGFREYYNPQTGEGYGAQGFTWPGLILDMEEEGERAAKVAAR